MSRTIRNTLLVAVCLAGVLAGGAPSVPGQAPRPANDVVSGSALLDFEPPLGPDVIPLYIGASSGPDGENPGGRVSILLCWPYDGCQTHTSDFGGEVTCVNVQGNRAIVGYYGFGGTFTPFILRGLVEVVDNGPASALADTIEFRDLGADQNDPRWPDIPRITDCPSTLPDPDQPVYGMLPGPEPGDPLYDPSPALQTLQDFTVVDAHRLPTSKDQCKNGGWRTYGVFRNQGDCVSFVATGGRNRPSG